MALYLVYVDDSKELANYRIVQGKVPLAGEQRLTRAKQLIGNRPYLYLTADDKSEIEEKLREFGFNSKIEFIQNYSKVV
jgi:phage gpG-like protein